MTWKIGHRGASGHEPENTLLAMRKALELGCDGIECDVHLCKSGEPVVIHDTTLKRTTNGQGYVARKTLTELRELNAGKGERIPTLEELLEVMRGKMVFIEIKDEAAADAVAKLVEKRGDYARLPVISFKRKPLQRILKLNSKILVGATPSHRRIPANFIARALDAGMWSVNPCIDIVTKRFVDDAHKHGLKVITWTANKPTTIKKAYDLGIDGIISDFPDLL